VPLSWVRKNAPVEDDWRTLRNRSLLRMLAGFAVLNLSEWGFVTALSVHAFHAGGALDVGLIGIRLLAGAVSSAVLAPISSARRGVLSLVALMRTSLLGAAAVLALTGSPFLVILVCVVGDAVVAAVYRPAQSRVMPSLARSPSELTQAVAGTSMAKTIGQAGGALMAGGAIQLISPEATMACEAGLMLLAALCTAGIAGSPVRTLAEDRPGRLHDGLSAFPEVLGDVYAWPLVAASVLRVLVRGLWGALLVVVALRLLHSGDSSVGLLQAATGIGALVALPLTAAQIGRAHLAIPCAAAFVLSGVTVGLIGAASALAVVAVLVFLWGAAMALADATSLSLLHRVLPSQLFSRTLMVMESLKLVSEGAGALLAPALVAIFGLRSALFIAGLPLPLLVVATWVRVRRSDELGAGRGAVVSLLHQVELFHGLDMASLEQLAASAVDVEVTAGQEPIVQGEIGDRFYVIRSGLADVIIDGLKVKEIGAGDGFGDRALLRNTPRTATIRARSDLCLLAIDREAFMVAVTGEAGIRVDFGDLVGTPVKTVLRSLAIFNDASDTGLDRVAQAASRTSMAPGTVIFDVGDKPDSVYVILSGRVEMLLDGQVTSVLLPGDCFGELSVLHGASRTRRAVLAEPSTFVVLPAEVVLAEARSSPATAGGR
jgi:CRP-like cAMP-binding protein